MWGCWGEWFDYKGEEELWCLEVVLVKWFNFDILDYECKWCVEL